MKRKPTRHKVNARRASGRFSKLKFIEPRSLEEFLSMPTRDQDTWDIVGQVTTEIRLGATLAQASRKFEIDPRKALRLARPALRKRRNGRWAAKKSDRLLRVLPLPNSKGLIDIGVPDSRQATLVGNYWNAVDLHVGTGDSSALQFFYGKYITDAEGRRVPFMTNTDELDRLASAGKLSFETMYARVRADVIRLIRRAFDHSHETSTSMCRELRKQHGKQVSRLRGLDSWEKCLLAAAKGLLMPQAGMKMNCVLSDCRLALDELETRFYRTYHSARGETSNADWRFTYSWIAQESDWQQQHSLRVPPYLTADGETPTMSTADKTTS